LRILLFLGIVGIKKGGIRLIRIFFLKLSGNILLATSGTTRDQDLSIYKELQNNDIDFIELDNGISLHDFSNFKSCKINIETKELEIIYYTKEELNTIQEQINQNKDLSSRVSDVSAYLNNNTTIITNIEDLILQTEQNKIINGGM
jgi:hypothetical protein